MKGQQVASIVSRKLAAAGERPLPSGMRGKREGITVSGGGDGRAFVSVDHDSREDAKNRTDRLQDILEADGYRVERYRDAGLTVTVQ